MNPKLLCPSCHKPAFPWLAKFLAFDFSPRACRSCGSPILIRQNFWTLLFTLFGLVPASQFSLSWERFVTIIVFFSLAGLVRVYFLELYERP